MALAGKALAGLGLQAAPIHGTKAVLSKAMYFRVNFKGFPG